MVDEEEVGDGDAEDGGEGVGEEEEACVFDALVVFEHEGDGVDAVGEVVEDDGEGDDDADGVVDVVGGADGDAVEGAVDDEAAGADGAHDVAVSFFVFVVVDEEDFFEDGVEDEAGDDGDPDDAEVELDVGGELEAFGEDVEEGDGDEAAGGEGEEVGEGAFEFDGEGAADEGGEEGGEGQGDEEEVHRGALLGLVLIGL